MPILLGQTSEFIAAPLPAPSVHASTIVETPNGDLLAAWFGGTAEGRPDVAIWGSRKPKGGAWSKAEEWAREPNIATFNPVLFYTKDGRLWLYYKFGPHPTSWTAARRFSRDHGKTWSPIEHLPAGLWGPIRVKPLQLDDGTIVSGTSAESYRSWAVWIERSSDHGKTWTKHGPVQVPETQKLETDTRSAFSWSHTHGIIQPVLIPMGGRRIRLFARATGNIGRVAVADSPDNGVTWSEARPIDVPNPNSGIDLVRLNDGRIIMIYNHTSKGRSPLNLAISKDGEKFRMFHALESEPGGEFSYPAMIVGADGSLHITYTHHRKNIKYVHFPASMIPAD